MNLRFVLFSVVYSSASERTFGSTRNQTIIIRIMILIVLLVLFSVAHDEQFFGTSLSRSEVRASNLFLFCFLFCLSVELNSTYAEVNFVTALVPSDTACLANSPGKINLTDVWISLDVTVGFLLYRANLAASVAIFSKMSLMKEFMMPIALEEMPVSGCTCFKTL